MYKIAVYGSLLEGLGNHPVIGRDEESKIISSEVVSIPYGMISYRAFPALVPSSENHNIFIEIYEVNEETYRRVERLEGYPTFYQKAIVNTTKGPVEIYVIQNEVPYEKQPESQRVPSGDWREYKLGKTVLH